MSSTSTLRLSLSVLLATAGLLAAPAAHGERQLYIANRGNNTLTIYDYLNGSVVSQLAVRAVCQHPHALAVQPGGSAAYLSCEDGEVWSINALGLSVSPLAVGTSSAPDLAVDASGSHVWIADFHPGTVTRLDIPTLNEQSFTAPLRPDGTAPGAPAHVAITNDGAWVYVASNDGVLWRIAAAGSTVEYLYDFATGIGDLAMSPSGNYVYLTGSDSYSFYSVQLTLSAPRSTATPRT